MLWHKAGMKLFYVPGVCSMVPHITLREGGFEFELDLVDVKNDKRTAEGQSYVALNPRGYVPALLLDDGTLMTEAQVIAQYLADQKPETKLAPAWGTRERYQVMQWLNFCATELHKTFSPFFHPAAGAEFLAAWRARLDARLQVLSDAVVAGPWLMGEQFTIADVYAFYVMRMFQKQPVIKGTLNPVLTGYYARIASRPAVKKVLEVEGLEA